MSGLTSALSPAVSRRMPQSTAAPTLVGVATLIAIVTGVVAFAWEPSATIVVAHRYLVLDATSRLFLMLINFIFLGISTYVWTRVEATPALRQGLARFVVLALIFLIAGNLAILSNHLLLSWALLEVTTLAAAPLITFRGGPATVLAAWKYLLFSSVGLGLTFLGFVCLGKSVEAGGLHEPTFFLDGLSLAAAAPADAWRRIGLALIFIGYGTKLGLVPMYVWLPETYAAAPPPVTALLAAVQFNVALVGVFRVLQVFRSVDQRMVALELIGLGVVTMAVSASSIVATRNYKKLVAYASMNHAGVIAIGLGIGGSATYGVVLYVVSNAIIKAILFLTAGKIRSHYQSEDVGEVSGLVKDMPYTGSFFAVGIFALLGLPPFGSFLGELLIMGGLIRGGYLAVFAAFCAILTATFIATGRTIFPMIWGEPRKRLAETQPFGAIAPKLFFVVALIIMGMYIPRPVNLLFRQVATSLGGP